MNTNTEIGFRACHYGGKLFQRKDPTLNTKAANNKANIANIQFKRSLTPGHIRVIESETPSLRALFGNDLTYYDLARFQMYYNDMDNVPHRVFAVVRFDVSTVKIDFSAQSLRNKELNTIMQKWKNK